MKQKSMKQKKERTKERKKKKGRKRKGGEKKKKQAAGHNKELDETTMNVITDELRKEISDKGCLGPLSITFYTEGFFLVTSDTPFVNRTIKPERRRNIQKSSSSSASFLVTQSHRN